VLNKLKVLPQIYAGYGAFVTSGRDPFQLLSVTVLVHTIGTLSGDISRALVPSADLEAIRRTETRFRLDGDEGSQTELVDQECLVWAGDAVKDNKVTAERLAAEQKREQVVKRRRTVQPDGLVRGVEAKLGDATAQSMSITTTHPKRQASTIAAAAGQASIGVGPVVAATEQLTASVRGGSREGVQSSKITGRAAADARHGMASARGARKVSRKGVDGSRNAMTYRNLDQVHLSTVKSHVVGGPLSKPRAIYLICREGRTMQRMPPDHIDLSPLLTDPAAAEILMRARGQLNRAFRTHGLIPPDSLDLDDSSDIDTTQLDDPAARGIDEAMARFDESFLNWSGRMPLMLARPILDILRRTYQVLEHRQDSAAGASTLKAYKFLLECWERATEQIPDNSDRVHG
jgi:hypothetical protein